MREWSPTYFNFILFLWPPLNWGVIGKIYLTTSIPSLPLSKIIMSRDGRRELDLPIRFLSSGLFNFSLSVAGESYNCQGNDNVNTIKHIIEHWTQITDHWKWLPKLWQFTAWQNLIFMVNKAVHFIYFLWYRREKRVILEHWYWQGRDSNEFPI